MLIGHVVRPHGIGGAVRVRPTGATVAGLEPGESVSVGGRTLLVRATAGTPEQPIVSFDDIRDRDAARALAGAPLRVSGDRLPALAEDAWYVHELVGCRVVCDGAELGEVRDVEPKPAGDLLVIAGPSGDLFVPLVRAAVVRVDLPTRCVTVAPGFAIGPGGEA